MLALADIFFVGIALAVMSVPFLWDLIPRNHFYGFRVPGTLRNDAVWYAINRWAAKRAIAIGLVLALAAWLLDVEGLDTPVARTLLSISMFAALAIFTIRGWIDAGRMARGQR
jgi:uncharacterized membrane protein